MQQLELARPSAASRAGPVAIARGGRSSCAAGSDKPAVPPDKAAAAAPPDGRSAS